MKYLYYIKDIFDIAGLPGWLLIGYNVVLTVFARAKADANAVDFTAIIFASYALGAGLYCYRQLLRTPQSSHFFKYLFFKSPILFFALYTVWCFISALWSPNMVLTAYRAVECFGLLIVIIATIDRLIQETNIEGVVLWSVVYAFLTVVFDFVSALIKINMDYGLYHAQFTATIFFYLVFFYAPKNFFRYPVMLIALLCRSTTGYMGMATGLASLLFGSNKFKSWGLIMSLGILMAIGTLGIDKVLNNTIFVTKKEVIKDGEFDMAKTSGRDKIWERSIEMVEKKGKQWTGFGFVAGETAFTYSFIGTHVIGLHNGYLSAYVGTGLIGLVFFTLFMLGYFKSCIYKGYPGKIRSLLIASMCLVFFHTLGNPGLGFRVYGTWMPAMFIVIMTLGIKYSIDYRDIIEDSYEDNLGDKKFS